MAAALLLLVDDDFLIRLNTAEILEDAGFRVVEANDAASALAALQERTDIDLVCTDVHMPGQLDGVDLINKINQHWPHVRTIMISSCSRSRFRLPGTPFLTKPFIAASLVNLVRAQLRPSNEKAVGQ